MISSLSWGTQHELLSGSRYLKLWNVHDGEGVLLWHRELASQVQTAVFSPDYCLVASIGYYDQNVKIWNRLSFDLDNLDFDFTYLPHNDIITSIRWRQSLYPSQTIDNTLYTTCRDNALRIWQPFDTAVPTTLQLWYIMDLFEGEYHDIGTRRFAFVLDNGDLAKAVENTLTRAHDLKLPSIQRIAHLAQSSPDLCVVIEEDNTMSIYSLENIGQKYNKLITSNKIASKLRLPSRFPINAPYLSFFPFFNLGFNNNAHDDKLKDISIIVHDHAGCLLHYTAYLDRMLDPQVVKKHWSLKTILTGHSKSVQRLRRTVDGRTLFSASRFSENYVWRTHILEGSVTLQRKSMVITPKDITIKRAVILRHGNYIVSIQGNSLCVWDCRKFKAVSIEEKPLHRDDDPEVLILIPESHGSNNIHHIVAIYSDKAGRLWEINLPDVSESSHEFQQKSIITDLGDFTLPLDDELLMVVRVDPVGWTATVSHDLESSQRVVIATISPSGTFRCWTASVSPEHKIGWLALSTIETGLQHISRMEVSSINKVAFTCSSTKKLSIWDTKNQVLEFEQEFESLISDLDWTSTPDLQGMLAIGLTSHVVIYSQLRFDYTNKTPSWTPVKQIDISMYTTHGIGDSIWLYGGALAIGAGNQFFIADGEADIRDSNLRVLIGSNSKREKDQAQEKGVQVSTGLFEVCTILNGPLPVYHPQFLIQSLFADKFDMVKHILGLLLKKIKFSVVLDNNVVDISSALDLTPDDILELMGEESDSKQRFSFVHRSTVEDTDDIFESDTPQQLSEWLQKVSLPFLTQHQQITLATVVESVSKLIENFRSLDTNGIKYLLGYRLYAMHRGVQESMTTRDFNWAMHSESQDVIYDVIKNDVKSTFLWPNARDTGMAYWLRKDKLVETFELLARNHFIKSERDPTKCALYYLALRKKQVLLGLWRTASGHKEQTKTMKLLANDFTAERWRTAALKNAFALLGKHRYDYAAAFFLLGDSLREAVGVIAKNMGDIGLAIAVARVYGGDAHPAFLGLLERFVFPKAVQDGDRWTTSWALWRLGSREKSLQALVKSPLEIMETCDNITLSDIDKVVDNKSFLVEDPVLLILYRYLRKRNMKLFIGAVELGANEEFQFVLKTANIYRRMGCDILALSLIKNWDFSIDRAAMSSGLVSFRGSQEGSVASTPIPSNTKPSISAISEYTSGGGSILDNKKLREAIAARRNSLFGGNAAAAAAFAAISSSPLPSINNPADSTDGNEQDGKQEKDKKDNPFKNFKPAPAVAFQEPDLSSFSFGS